MQNDRRLVPSLRHITLFARSSAVVWNEQYSLPPSFIADHLELLQFLTVADCCSACQTCTPCEVSCPDKRVGPVTTYTFRYAVQIRTQLLLFLSSLPASSTGQLRRRYTAFNCVCVSLYVRVSSDSSYDWMRISNFFERFRTLLHLKRFWTFLNYSSASLFNKLIYLFKLISLNFTTMTSRTKISGLCHRTPLASVLALSCICWP